MAKTFSNQLYKSDAGKSYTIRVSGDVMAITGNTPSAGPNDDKHVEVTVTHHGSRRRSGIFARGLVLERGEGTIPNVKKFRTFVPVLQQTSYQTLVAQATVDYAGFTWQVLDGIPEA